jgi:tetratricopeptide (TPR) repeat protein
MQYRAQDRYVVGKMKMYSQKSLAGLVTSGLLLLGMASLQTVAWGQTPPSTVTTAESERLAADPLRRTQPSIRSLLPDDSLQEFCRDVRINAIVVPAFCTLIVQARNHYQQGNLQSAADLYDRALQRNPQYSRGYYNRGIVYLSMGQTAEAKRDFAQAAHLFQKQGDTTNFRKAVALADGLGS